MAEFRAKTRSNYFQVKDTEAFEQFCDQFELVAIQSGDKSGFIVASVEGAIPRMLWDKESSEQTEIDFLSLLAEHLVEGQVAVLIEIGWVKEMTQLSGLAVAINAQGQQQEVDLRQIYEKAGELGEMVTLAEY